MPGAKMVQNNHNLPPGKLISAFGDGVRLTGAARSWGCTALKNSAEQIAAPGDIGNDRRRQEENGIKNGQQEMRLVDSETGREAPEPYDQKEAHQHRHKAEMWRRHSPSAFLYNRYALPSLPTYL